MRRIAVVVGVVALAAWAGIGLSPLSRAEEKKDEPVVLGAFSVSLTVKDLAASRAFYEKLGFQAAGNHGGKNWQVLRNGTTTIGLFHGMFERNSLTFNPGWTQEAKPLEKFQDVRDIQRILKSRGLKPVPEADEASKGPAYFIVTDPDGNPVLLDQHVPRPGG